MSSYADVALPVAVDKAFTYLIPPELQQSALVGTRVIVPFGRKHVTGLIIGLPASTSVPGLKPIKDILDASPVVPNELLRLCTWISEYYFAPIGEVLKAAIPHGFTTKGKRIVRLARQISEAELETLRKHSRQRSDLLALIMSHGGMLSTELQRKRGVKNINAALNELAREGYIEVEEVIPTPKQPVFTREVVLIERVDLEQLDETLATLSPRRKKARQLLLLVRTLKEQGTPEIPSATLLKRTGTSSAVLKIFKDSGLLPAVRQTVLRQQDYGTEEQTLTIVLNDAQRQVLQHSIEALNGGTHKTFLLHGVTGSGKTQVYIEAIRHCLSINKTAIVLVPEISLTPQIVRRFKSHFADRVGVVHSRMSPRERLSVWHHALTGRHAIIVGPRSAIFAPLQNVGLIVIDEEHEASYKQYDASPRYNARDAGIVRATYNNAVVILGTATPSVESYFNALSGKYQLLEMPRRIDDAPLPDITVVDMIAERKRAYAAQKDATPIEQRKALKTFQEPAISQLLKEKMLVRLRRREGIILLQNRRGFAPFVECLECGYTEMCAHCSITLTYHLTKKHLRCHYCGATQLPHAQCPQCRGQQLQLRGIGTQRVQEELTDILPDARILRMDLDTTTRKGAHDALLRKFAGREADILLGTQMVAKGLDFPRVTLVGVVSADTQMLLPDFRASERTFQLLTQVAGRSGRSTLRGEVIIQTHQPRHYVLEHVVDHDFRAFYQQELESRGELAYPPFSRLVLIETKGEKEHEVQKESERFAALLKNANGSCTVLGPTPAVIARVRNNYRWHILLKSMKTVDPAGAHIRATLRRTLAEFAQQQKRSVRLIIDVDPMGLM
jgi:primosomal protein N' (replication factor Y)